MPSEVPQDEIERLTDAVRRGRKIEAIKLYRAATGAGLKDAKDAVEELAERLQEEGFDAAAWLRPAMGQRPPDPGPTPEDTERIADAVRQGRKIEAIKLYRAATGKGLKESKEFIDELADQLGEEQADSPTEETKSQGGCLLTACMLLAGLVGLGYWCCV